MHCRVTALTFFTVLISIYARDGGDYVIPCVCVSVGLSAGLHKKLHANLAEIFWEG